MSLTGAEGLEAGRPGLEGAGVKNSRKFEFLVENSLGNDQVEKKSKICRDLFGASS